MSLHAALSPEALATLRSQQRKSTLSSIIIAILTVCLIGTILLMMLLPAIDNFTPEIVSYQSGEDKTEKQQKRMISRSVEKKPSSPSSAMARVIASNTVSDIAIPVPTEITTIDSLEFGNGDADGEGWGSDDWGGGSGGTTFFGETISGDRILYVIDYSASMKGDREALMRAELSKSVAELPAGKQYQMIFFSGPTWIAGDEMTGLKEKGKKGNTITGKGGREYEWIATGGSFGFDPIGTPQKPYWLESTDRNIKKSVATVLENKLSYGTNWVNPLEMAFNLDPLPNVIIFMTDGLSQGDPLGVAEKFSDLAKKNGVIINAIALMEPKAAEAMDILAGGTGGKFSLINADGEKVEPGDIKGMGKKKGKGKGKGKDKDKDKK